jgi:Zn-dependent peptidase ImmA (M78 family)/transcriptional regulator with XRE-family HTH domain
MNIPINIEILKWARDAAGFSLIEAAERSKINPIKQKGSRKAFTPGERLAIWESGEDTPSFRQLERIAKAYRRPILTFFLSNPPIEETSLNDFRTVADRKILSSPELSALKRRIELLHENIKNILQEEEQEPLSFVGKFTMDLPPSDMAKEIRKILNFLFIEQRRISSRASLLAELRKRAHHCGIFVLFEGDLGSHHSRIDPEEFRGMAICDEIAPLIVINKNDYKAAQLFTFIHEIGHILLGSSGISNFDSVSTLDHQFFEDKERYCNQVAAEFLVPSEILIEIIPRNEDEITSSIDYLSTYFKVSRLVIARRLYDLNAMNKDQYWYIFEKYQKEWVAYKVDSKSSPTKNILDKYRLGSKVITTIINAVAAGKLGYAEATKILNVKLERFDLINK